VDPHPDVDPVDPLDPVDPHPDVDPVNPHPDVGLVDPPDPVGLVDHQHLFRCERVLMVTGEARLPEEPVHDEECSENMVHAVSSSREELLAIIIALCSLYVIRMENTTAEAFARLEHVLLNGSMEMLFLRLIDSVKNLDAHGLKNLGNF